MHGVKKISSKNTNTGRYHLFIVALAHAILIVAAISPYSRAKPLQTKKIIVRTVAAASTQAHTAVKAASKPLPQQPAPSAAAIKKQPPAPAIKKVEATKQNTQTKPAPKAKPSSIAEKKIEAKQSPQAPSQLAELEKRIHKIQDRQKRKEPERQIHTPTWQYVAAEEESPFTENSSGTIEDEIMSFLQAHLNLPDYGEVKVKVLINTLGTIEQCTVLFSESEKNKRYILDELKNRVLPLSKKSLSLKSSQTFVLTFCNQL